MNKNKLILLALAANAHVHGVDNTSNKHDNESILGKRANTEANDNLTKRQKIDQNISKQIVISMDEQNDISMDEQSDISAHVHGSEDASNKHYPESILGKRTDQNITEQIDTSMAEQNDISMVRAVKFTDSNLFNLIIPKQHLTIPDVLKMGAVSRDTRKKFKALLPEKYNNETKQWEELKKGDNRDECFARCMTTLLIPNTDNSIQDLPGIIGNKRVNHIKAVFIEASPESGLRPEWKDTVNNVFTDPNPDNNSLIFKVVQPNGRPIIGWNIENVLSSLTKANHVIFEGQTGDEDIAIESNSFSPWTTILGGYPPHTVAVRNARPRRAVKMGLRTLMPAPRPRTMIQPPVPR